MIPDPVALPSAKIPESPIDEEPAIPRKHAPRRRKKVILEEQDTEPSTEPEFEDDSPLDADAAAQTSMVEVERVGPGEGPGWSGMNYNGIPVSKGRVGWFPRTRDVYDRVQALAGGAEYRFVTSGRKPVFKKLPGPPRSLGGEASVDYGLPIDPLPPSPYYGMPAAQPYAPPPSGQQWWNYYGNLGNGIEGEEVRALREKNLQLERERDLERLQKQYDDKVDRLIDEIRDLKARPQDDKAMTAIMAMMQSQTSMMTGFMQQQAVAASAMATANAAASKDAAAIQVAALERVAGAQAAANQAVLQATTQSTSQLVQVLTSRSEQGSFKEQMSNVLEIAEHITGGKSDNAAAEISSAVKEVAPALAESIRDTVYAIKGLPVGTNAPQNGKQQPQADTVEIGKRLQFVGYLCNAMKAGMKPTMATFAHGTVAFNLHQGEKFIETRDAVIAATPEQIVDLVDQAVGQLGNPTAFAGFVDVVKETILSVQGREWLTALKKALVEKVEADKLAATAPPTQIPSAQ